MACSNGSLCEAASLYEKVYGFLLENKELHAQVKKEIEVIRADPSLKEKKRRYSDQFRSVALDRLSQELSANRAARQVCRFKKDHAGIADFTDRWRDALVSSFKELADLCSIVDPSDLEEMYHTLSLETAGITRSELGVEHVHLDEPDQ